MMSMSFGDEDDDFLSKFNEETDKRRKLKRKPTFERLTLKPIERDNFTKQKESFMIHRLTMNNRYASNQHPKEISKKNTRTKLDVYLPSLATDVSNLDSSMTRKKATKLSQISRDGVTTLPPIRVKPRLKPRNSNLSTKDLSDLFSKLRLHRSGGYASYPGVPGTKYHRSQSDWT